MSSNWKLVQPQNFPALQAELQAKMPEANIEVLHDSHGELSITADSETIFTAYGVSPLTWRVPLHTLSN